jgi:vitamin B12 transporter
MRHSFLLDSLLRVSCSAVCFLAVASVKPVQAQVPDVAPLSADDEDEVIIRSILEQPVSGPTRSESTVQDLSRPTYVVTQEEIKQRGARTVQEALRYLPGILSDGTAGGQLGAVSSQFVRGASSRQVLILLDGRPINDRGFFGGFDLSTFTTTNVERIEVIPGGGSALYGSDAVGGIINIVSKRPTTKPEIELGLSLGSFGYNQVTIASRGKSGSIDWMASYNRTQSDNDFPYKVTPEKVDGVPRKPSIKGERDHAAVLYNNADLRLEYDLNPRNSLALGITYQAKEFEIPGSIRVPIVKSLANQYTNQWFTDLSWTSKLGKADESKLTARIFGDFLGYTYNNRSGSSLIVDQINRKSLGAQVQHIWQFSKGQNLSYGIDYRSTTGRNTTFSNLSRTTLVNYDDSLQEGALFASYQAVLGDLQISAGLRQDFNSLANASAFSPSAGLKFNVSPSTTLRANISRSFRAPLISDIAGVTAYGQLPNPDLKPERGTNIDVGIDQKLGKFGLFRLTYFDNNVSDLTDYLCLDSACNNGRIINIGRVRSRGIETALNLQISKRWSTFVNYTINDPIIKEDSDPSVVGNELSFRSADSLNAGVTYATPQGVSASLLMRNLSKFYVGNDNTEELPGYTTFDFKLKAPLDANLMLTFQVNNLFDKQYQLFPNVPALGRNFQAGVSYRF